MRGFRVDKQKHIGRIIQTIMGNILHVGCTDSPDTLRHWEYNTLLHKEICELARESGAKVIGIDIDQEAIDFLSAKMPNETIMHLDAHQISTIGMQFNLIVAGDVIEHLHSPGLFLNSLHKVLSDDGRLIITTTNSYGIVRFLKAFLFHEAVHDEHTAYYSHKTIGRLLHMTGYKMVDAGYYKGAPLVGFSLNRCISNLIEDITCAIFPQYSEGLFIIAQKSIPNGDRS